MQTKERVTITTVSYLVATFNRRDLLSECLESIRKQEWPDKQVVVVVDGSTDGTAEMLAECFPEAECVVLDTNMGAARARNKAFDRIKGQLCVFLDDDALLRDEDATIKAVKEFEEHPSLGILDFHLLNTDGTVQTKHLPWRDRKERQGVSLCSYFVGAGAAVRTDVFRDVGGFWNNLYWMHEELELSWRVLDKGYDILHSDEIVVIHHMSPVGRPKGRFVYHGLTHILWVSVRHLPWRYVCLSNIVWWGYLFFTALRRGEIGFFLRGGVAALKGMPNALRARKVLNKQTINYLKENSGRHLY